MKFTLIFPPSFDINPESGTVHILHSSVSMGYVLSDSTGQFGERRIEFHLNAAQVHEWLAEEDPYGD